MDTKVKTFIDELARVELVDVPAGEQGIFVRDESGAARQCAPVLSVYLDVRPLFSGAQTNMRASRVTLRERLHQIAQTFWPRGLAYDSILSDTQRIEAFLDTEVPSSAHGVAIFAGAAHHLFKTFISDVPFEDAVTALAMPDLFQLAGLLDDREVALVVVARTHATRLFITHRGGMREVRGLAADQKYFHQVRRTNAMNQAHYQRHARQTRADFARMVADEIERLVKITGAREIILGGDAVAVPVLRQALAPAIAQLAREPRVPLDLEATEDELWEEVAPLLETTQREYEQSVAEQLLEAVRADGLGVVGATPTHDALAAGQADVLVIEQDAPLPEAQRSELVALASKSDAEVDVIEHDTALDAVGGVGALLRYRIHA